MSDVVYERIRDSRMLTSRTGHFWHIAHPHLVKPLCGNRGVTLLVTHPASAGRPPICPHCQHAFDREMRVSP